MRQGCSLSSDLFNTMLADVEEEMGKIRWGSIRLGGRSVFTLAYEDDLVIMAEEEEEMKSMRLRG